MRGLQVASSPTLPVCHAALTSCTKARSNQAEGRRAQKQSAFCTSSKLRHHTAIIKTRSFTIATWRSNSNKPSTSHSFHLPSGKSLPVWTDAIKVLVHVVLCCFFFPIYFTFLLLKRTNQPLQPACSPDGKRWLNIKPEQFAIQIPT